MSFFPVDRDVFTSSIWLSGTAEERVLWIWLLGNRDAEGVVRHRTLAIADGAKLPRPVVEAALQKFSEPDPDSRTADNDGRRIGRTDDGFVRILNHGRYVDKDYSTPRWRRWAERRKAAGVPRSAAPTVPTRLHVGGPLENVGPTKNKNKNKNTEGRKEAPPAPALPPADAPPSAASRGDAGETEADRGEAMLRAGRVAREREFYSLVARIAAAEGMDGTEVARQMTAYERDGQPVAGQVRPETLSDARLDRSLVDGRAWLEALEAPRG